MTGHHKPLPKQKEKIIEGIQRIGNIIIPLSCTKVLFEKLNLLWSSFFEVGISNLSG